MTSAAPSATRDRVDVCEVSERALRIWPALDPWTLFQVGCDPDRIVVFVARETSLSIEVISGILVGIERGEPPFYFG